MFPLTLDARQRLAVVMARPCLEWMTGRLPGHPADQPELDMEPTANSYQPRSKSCDSNAMLTMRPTDYIPTGDM